MFSTITGSQTIQKILKAVKLEDILDINNLKEEYRSIVSLIHPDIDPSPEAAKATSKLNELKQEYESGKSYKDETGLYKCNGYKTIYSGDLAPLQISLRNYNIIRHEAKVKVPHLLNYIPDTFNIENGKLTVTYKDRVVSLSKLTLPEEHVRWIFSRLLEFVSLSNQLGFTHCGLNPESVFIVPETHGIIISSFYHSVEVNEKVQTIAGPYKSWYPAKLFKDKKANPFIDLELCKKIAINLLGDSSGVGIKLKKTNNEKFIDYLIKQDTDPFQCYDNYRRLLKANFKTEFHVLNI